MWIAAGLIGLATVAPGLDQVVDDADPPAEAAEGYSISRAADGQFYVEGRAGELPLRFLIDPGSDAVLVAGPDAAALGFGGEPAFATVTIPRLAIGPHELRNVRAVVAPDLPVSLLGRSFLDRLAAAEVRGNRMVLR